jgi:hypothetical protein
MTAASRVGRPFNATRLLTLRRAAGASEGAPQGTAVDAVRAKHAPSTASFEAATGRLRTRSVIN